MMPFLALLLAPAVAQDPFERWPEHDSGPAWGVSYGIAVGDVDGDGWTDVIVPQSWAIWFNDQGQGWTYKQLPELQEHGFQYGGSLGDYDGDGLPDLSSEPRGTPSMLLHNDGGGEFTKLPETQFPIPFPQNAETNGWIDADGDGFLDLFVPAYFGANGFYQNLGPGTGEWTFDEKAIEIGIVTSITAELRPEGAQFCDVDRDGDADLYVCGELFRNVSTPGDPQFISDAKAGIVTAFDEGAAFADIDMDGDFDLLAVYHDASPITYDFGHVYVALIWQNLGDSTFALLDESTLPEADIDEQYNLGMSFADWDNDGDPDVTFSNRWERNEWVETGNRQFTRIDTGAAQVCATPGWFDWDYDGDLDIANGIWGGYGQFYQNRLYDEVEPASRQVLRVRPLADSDDISEGLDTEFGATVDVRAASDSPAVHRRNFTASGHGYLNQSEYTLTFGLEGVADPVVDVTVDFTTPGDVGIWRIDKYVNPALGGLDVLGLADREVRVFRGGRVVVDGQETEPEEKESPLLETPGGIWQPEWNDTLATADEGTWVGVEVHVPEDADPERGAALREVLVEGVLGDPVTCQGTTGNVLVWDVGDHGAFVVGGEIGETPGDNRRTEVATDVVLRNGRTYQVMARVSDLRTFRQSEGNTWIPTPKAFTVTGVEDPCDASWRGDVELNDDEAALTIRYRERVVPVPENDVEIVRGGSCGCEGGGGIAVPGVLLLGLAAVVRRRKA